MNRKKIAGKPLCMTLLIAAFVYGLVLPFCWNNNPLEPLGTLSILCENRKIFFWIWALLVGGGNLLNTQYMYKKFDSKSKFLDILTVLSFVSVLLVALTLGHSIADWNPKRVIHWIATGCYIVFLFASLLLFFLKNIKKQKVFAVLSVCIAGILLLFVLLFAVIGKSGVMEIIPLALLQLLLFVVNFTPAVKVKATENKQALKRS